MLAMILCRQVLALFARFYIQMAAMDGVSFALAVVSSEDLVSI